MKRLYILAICATFLISGFAQGYNKQQKIEKIKAQKVAFITNKLALTAEEAQLFWPVYNAFFKAKEKLAQERKVINTELRQNINAYSDNKKTELSDKLVTTRLKEAQLNLEYHEKFKSILPIDKVLMLYNAESQFKTYLLRQIKAQNNKERSGSSRDARRK